jgi:hypothetical protein
MPTTTETAAEKPRTARDERTSLTGEAAPQVPEEPGPGERETERDSLDLSFNAGVRDAFGGGEPAPLRPPPADTGVRHPIAAGGQPVIGITRSAGARFP